MVQGASAHAPSGAEASSAHVNSPTLAPLASDPHRDDQLFQTPGSAFATEAIPDLGSAAAGQL